MVGARRGKGAQIAPRREKRGAQENVESGQIDVESATDHSHREKVRSISCLSQTLTASFAFLTSSDSPIEILLSGLPGARLIIGHKAVCSSDDEEQVHDQRDGESCLFARTGPNRSVLW